MITNHSGISGSRTAYMLTKGIKEKHRLLAVVSSGQAAARLAGDLVFYMPELNVIVLPEEEDVQVLYEARDRGALVKRIQAPAALTGSAPDGDPETGAGMTAVIAPVSAAVKLTESPERFARSVIRVAVGMRTDPHDLRRQLSEAGYQAAAVTESPGEYTSRGGILDVFSPAMETAMRIEFFDDEIDSIRTFDVETQRSIDALDKAIIVPAAEFIPNNEEKEKALAAVMKEYDRMIRRFRKEHAHPDVADGRIDAVESYRGRVKDIFGTSMSSQLYADLIGYFDVDKCRIWDHASNAFIAVCDPATIKGSLPDNVKDEDFFDVYKDAYGSRSKRNVDIYTPFPETVPGVEKMDRIDNVRSRQIAPFNGHIELFASETGRLAASGFKIVIAAGSDERNERVREYLEIAEVSGDISYRTGSLSGGFIMDDEQICFISGHDIFSGAVRSPRRKSKRRKSSRDSIRFSDLHKGDYVVHEMHGIGRFEGIKPVTADGITRDYLLIRYAGTDMLYIPTEQLDVIQKYIGNSGNPPALSRLSGTSWKRTRERARKAAMEIAEDLIKLYARRQAGGGYAFGPDTVWQTEFEEAFPYVETDDQLRATEEIKEDMEKPLPMDRLLCGDVGYGKTEVAARAVFKCISEGKQAAILAPTTLLVNQHYHNLRDRFDSFPFEIEELSRFRAKTAITKTIRGIKSGRVDLVIGTHRLLSEDVRFKDLGLLVVDEEQRFGVRHKEKIKELKSSIDVLTLSATPIPRTLNMSLTGIKDISLIEEPPGDRLPVHTYVTPYDEEILRNAITRELARGGQVFVVSNRIMGINTIAETITGLVPEAIVGVGHGRMHEEDLENTMLDFIEGRINVLVATTIIENGIDIPNANTMIILNADRFGLAQLYQLRGRVGRSSRLAYAYLMYQPGKVLTEIARKRLAAIREFTEFGVGFKLAMRDLELRGAGNMLGEAQSGHIESIGYELYCKEIDRAVRMLKGEDVGEARSDITIDLPVHASIPADYIPDETLRLEAYRRIAGILDSDDAMDVTDELTDRYGDVPDEAIELISVSEIRAHAEYLGISDISRADRWIRIKFAPEVKVHPFVFVMAKSEYGERVSLMDGRAAVLSFHMGKELDLTSLLQLMRFLRAAKEDSRQLDS